MLPPKDNPFLTIPFKFLTSILQPGHGVGGGTEPSPACSWVPHGCVETLEIWGLGGLSALFWSLAAYWERATSFFTSQEDLNVIYIINMALKQRKGAPVQAAELPVHIPVAEHRRGHLLTLTRGCAGMLLL